MLDFFFAFVLRIASRRSAHFQIKINSIRDSMGSGSAARGAAVDELTMRRAALCFVPGDARARIGYSSAYPAYSAC